MKLDDAKPKAKRTKSLATNSRKMKVAEVVRTLKRDEKYKKLKETFSTHENFKIPVESLLDELKILHSDRLIRSLNSTDPKIIEKLLEANLKEQSIRARVTEILIRCVRSHSLLTKAINSLKYHLLMSYPDELKSFRTKEERNQIVTVALKRFDEYLADLAVLKESASLVASDIDKASWNLRLMVDTLKLRIGPDRHVM